MRILGSPTFGGLLLGLVFWWQSLTPTLIPRAAVTQAAISGACFAIGYAIGTVVVAWIGRLLAARDRAPGPGARRLGWIALGAGWLVGIVLGAVLWLGWQSGQRELMGMEPIGPTDAALMVAISAVAGALFLVIGRLVAAGVAALNRFSHRHLPAALAAPATIILLVALVVVLGGGVAWRALTAGVSAMYAPVNAGTREGTEMPDSPAVSGSPDSLLAWDTLGLQGREFVADATTMADLAAFHGADTDLIEPVRTYVGVDSAATPEERAELAVRELERAGGFDRAVIAVWVPTGSGWMIEEAAAALEQLHRGNTAIVGMQYSYMPSLFAVFMDSGAANEAGIELFNAVHERWSTLDPGQRPRLVLFGKSLSAAGVEAPFAGPDADSSVANFVARTDGALVVGAKKVNPILSQLTRERDPASPVWQPVFDEGRSVRFVNRDPDQTPMDPDWPAPRIVYLQHPSDPVPFWGVKALWWPPEWYDHPRGHDVPDAASWFPIVVGVQAVSDMIFQLSTPPGFGHVYSTDYADGWARVVTPEGWSSEDSERLDQFLAESVEDWGEVEP